MDEEYVHPCDINLGDIVEWQGHQFQAIKVQQIDRSKKAIRWNRMDANYETGTTYQRSSPATGVKLIKRAVHIIEEDLTPSDGG